MLENPLAPKFSLFGTPVIVSDIVPEGEVWFVPRLKVDLNFKIDPEITTYCQGRIATVHAGDKDA